MNSIIKNTISGSFKTDFHFQVFEKMSFGLSIKLI